MKKDRVSNHKRDEASLFPFPPLPAQMPSVPQSRSTSRAPLVIGTIVGVGLIALLIYAVPWGFVSQTLTDSFDSLSTQVKQVQFAQVKQSKKTGVPPEVPATAAFTDETAQPPEGSTAATSPVEATPDPEGSTPETPIAAFPSHPRNFSTYNPGSRNHIHARGRNTHDTTNQSRANNPNPCTGFADACWAVSSQEIHRYST